MTRAYDLVLLGATGFTGGLVAEHLARRLDGSDTSWAVAGRDLRRLEELRDDLAAIGSRPAVETVDVHDLVGLLDVAGRTRVLATTVGPYARHGELVVQACIRSGTDYADITGEPAFVNLLLERYDGDARQRGVRVVNCCGFDSVPHDLGARFTARQLPADAPMTVRGFVRVRGSASGGTWHTAIHAMAEAGPGLLRATSPGAAPAAAHRARALPARIVRAPVIGGYGVPLPTIDTSIVLRSARELDDYGPSFSYGHYAHVRQPATVAGMAAAGGALVGLAKLPPTRALLLRLREPGDGPSAQEREAGWFRVTFVGEAAGTRVVTRVSGGEPGYAETSRMLGETALALAFDDLPERGGVLTPAVAVGDTLQARLEAQGMTFEVVATA